MPTAVPVVTLLATPADADVLAAADAGGRIRLTLRNSLDSETRPRSMLTLDGVMKTSLDDGLPSNPAHNGRGGRVSGLVWMLPRPVRLGVT